MLQHDKDMAVWRLAFRVESMAVQIHMSVIKAIITLTERMNINFSSGKATRRESIGKLKSIITFSSNFFNYYLFW